MVKLMIKIHTLTGLKYFCKTTKSNPFNYEGSGVYWSRHIKKHSYKPVYTIVVGEYEDDDPKLIEDAVEFSLANNIVESVEWANLEIENGINGRPIKWSREQVKKIVPLFSSRKQVESKYPGILNAARREGLYEDYMKKYKEDYKIVWTFDMVLEEALKYETKYEFVQKSPHAAEAGRKWWKDITSHMPHRRKRKPKFNKEDALKEAKTYSHKDEYARLSLMSSWVRGKGWWEEATSHMVNPTKGVKFPRTTCSVCGKKFAVKNIEKHRKNCLKKECNV